MNELNCTMPRLVDQYKELCNDSRHYDQKLWIIPGAAYTLSALFYKVIIETTVLNGKVFLSLLNTLIFSGFLFQYVKDRAFQLEIQTALKKIQDRNKNELINVAQYTGELENDTNDRWFIRVTKKHSAANYVFYVMFITLLVDIVIAVHFLLKWLHITQ